MVKSGATAAASAPRPAADTAIRSHAGIPHIPAARLTAAERHVTGFDGPTRPAFGGRTPGKSPQAVTLAMNAARFAMVRWIFSSRVSDSWSRPPTPASFFPRTYSEQARSLHR